jgi:CBS domain-containing protein
MKVKHVMSRDIIFVSSRASFARLWEIIFKKDIHGLPVCEKGQLIGIIAEEDLLGKLYPSYEDYITDFTNARKFEDMEGKLGRLTKLTAKDIMNRKIFLTYPDRPIMRALSKMILRKVRQLPVVEPGSGNKLVGMVTKGDIFDALFNSYLKIPGRKKGKTKL